MLPRLPPRPARGGRGAQIKGLDFTQTLAKLLFDHHFVVLCERRRHAKAPRSTQDAEPSTSHEPQKHPICLIYTEADLDPHAIGDAQQIADYFRSLGYCVKTSDTDLFGDLDRVIPIASEITFASFDLLTHRCHIVEAGNNSFFRAMTGRIRLSRPSETTPTAGYVGKENTGPNGRSFQR